MRTPTQTPTKAWHQLALAKCAAQLGIDTAFGLSQAEAQRRLIEHGPNQLAQTPPRSPWLKLFDQFKNLLVLVLVSIGAALLAGAIGDVKDAAVNLTVVVFHAGLGFYQEPRAAATLAALKKMLAQNSWVRRNG